MSQTDAPAGGAGASLREESGSYKAMVLGLLVLVYAINFIDRNIISILGPAIQKDFGLTDFQLGALGGLYFALFYTILGIPIAALADRYNRVWIVSISLAFWSAMTAACGLANNYWQLALARFGVGVGEAGGSPPSHSIISDLFSPATRTTALSIYSLGIPIGSGFGILMGGYLVESLGWKLTFIVVGLPGVLLAVVLRALVREPVRGRYVSAAQMAQKSGFFETIYELISKPTFWLIAVGSGLISFAGYSTTFFNPLFMVQAFDIGAARIGELLFILTIFVAVGTFAGGALSDLLAKRYGPRVYALVPVAGAILALPPFLYAYGGAPNVTWFVIGLILPSVLSYFYLGPTFGMTQSIAPVRMRAMAVAILFLVLNLIGLAAGPTITGWMSDVFAVGAFEAEEGYRAVCQAAGGPAEAVKEACAAAKLSGIRVAMMAQAVVYAMGALCYVGAAFTLRRDMIDTA